MNLLEALRALRQSVTQCKPEVADTLFLPEEMQHASRWLFYLERADLIAQQVRQSKGDNRRIRFNQLIRHVELAQRFELLITEPKTFQASFTAGTEWTMPLLPPPSSRGEISL